MPVLDVGLRHHDSYFVGDEIMSGKYWDKPWSLIDGCTPCSPGCDNCWSMAMGKRFHKWPDKVIVRPDRLDIPRKTKKPTIFAIWNDLLHEDVVHGFISSVLDVVYSCPQHTFLLLTKRADRTWIIGNYIHDYGPLNNLYLGLTVCNQEEADEKMPALLQIPGKIFVSIEPMLGPIDFEKAMPIMLAENDLSVILGGETGPHARPMHPDWVRSVRDQCEAASVPFFLKYMNKKDGRTLDGQTYDELPWRNSEQ